MQTWLNIYGKKRTICGVASFRFDCMVSVSESPCLGILQGFLRHRRARAVYLEPYIFYIKFCVGRSSGANVSLAM